MHPPVEFNSVRITAIKCNQNQLVCQNSNLKHTASEKRRITDAMPRGKTDWQKLLTKTTATLHDIQDNTATYGTSTAWYGTPSSPTTNLKQKETLIQN